MILRIRGTRECDFIELMENGSIHVWVNGEESNFYPCEVERLKSALNGKRHENGFMQVSSVSSDAIRRSVNAAKEWRELRRKEVGNSKAGGIADPKEETE